LYREGELSFTSLLRASISAKFIYCFTVVAAGISVYTAYLTWIAFPYTDTLINISIPAAQIYGNPLYPEYFSPAIAIPFFVVTGVVIFYLVRKRELLTASTVASSLLFTSMLCFIQIFYQLFLCIVPLTSNEEKGRRVALLWLALSSLVIVFYIYHPEIWEFFWGE